MMIRPVRRFTPRLPDVRLRAWQTSWVKLIPPPLFDPISYLSGEVVSPKLAAEVFGPNQAAAVNSPQAAGTVKGV
jgi:hypothetical protein